MGKDGRKKSSFFRCPHCHAKVRRGALSCPECGSDKETGWSKDAHKWQADIPTGYAADDFDYDEFVAEEFPEHEERNPKTRGGTWYWWTLGILALIIFCIFVLSR